MKQSASRILMVRPAAFRFNEETAANNHFQQPTDIPAKQLQQQARAEFDAMTRRLGAAGIDVMWVEDSPEPVKPDALFPNNWISTTADGRIHLYPLFAPNRRLERNHKLVFALQQQYQVARVNDWSYLEAQDLFLEGTGSIVFDHVHKVAYAALSPRTAREALQLVAGAYGYEAFAFEARDAQNRPVYHTNVLLSIGTGFAVGCAASFVREEDYRELRRRMEASGREWIDLTMAEIEAFGANLLEVENIAGFKVIVLSQTAHDAFRPEIRRRLEAHAELLPVSVPTIESVNGGSVRCMMTEIFLKPKEAR